VHVFCFEQKTAYAFPNRDWRSDVGSSDLVVHPIYSDNGMKLMYSRLSALETARRDAGGTKFNFRASQWNLKKFKQTVRDARVLCLCNYSDRRFRAPQEWGMSDSVRVTPGEKTEGGIFTWFTVAGAKYVLDAAVLECEHAVRNHVVAGVTCNGYRMVYNGWKGSRGRACPLASIDWLHDTAYISTQGGCDWATPPERNAKNTFIVRPANTYTTLFYVNATN